MERVRIRAKDGVSYDPSIKPSDYLEKTYFGKLFDRLAGNLPTRIESMHRNVQGWEYHGLNQEGIYTNGPCARGEPYNLSATIHLVTRERRDGNWDMFRAVTVNNLVNDGDHYFDLIKGGISKAKAMNEISDFNSKITKMNSERTHASEKIKTQADAQKAQERVLENFAMR
jgi:hypothetical protein